MAKLPWFKFYAQDWLTDPRVLALTNEQRGIYHWLLCRQWHDGDLPGDVMHIYPLLPPGSDSAAVAFILSTFFPPDPDTTRRANPRLLEQQSEAKDRYTAQVAGAAHARATRLAKLRNTNLLRDSSPNIESKGRSKKVESEERVVGTSAPEMPVGLPPEVGAALLPYLNVGATARLARAGEVKMWVGGMRGSVPQEAIVRGIKDMVVANKPFTPVILKAFIVRAVGLLQGEAGHRAALDAQSSVSGQPDANQGHSGFSEDELE